MPCSSPGVVGGGGIDTAGIDSCIKLRLKEQNLHFVHLNGFLFVTVMLRIPYSLRFPQDLT